jgi:hypothetical protein
VSQVELDFRLFFFGCVWGGIALVVAWVLTWPAQYVAARMFPPRSP